MNISGQETTNRPSITFESVGECAASICISDTFSARIRPSNSHTVDAMKAATELSLVDGRRLRNIKIPHSPIIQRTACTNSLNGSYRSARQHHQVIHGN